MGAILIFALAPAMLFAFDIARFDKLAHLAAFFVLAILGAAGWPRWRATFLLGLPLLGVGLEAAQTLSPGREFDWGDALVNAVGVGCAVAVSAALTARRD